LPESLRELLHEEGHALSSVVERRAKRGAGLGAENSSRDQSRRPGIERLHCELGEPARATQVRAEPPKQVTARDLLASICREDEKGPLLRGFGERGQQLQGRRIRPLEVVEKDDGRLARRDRREGVSHRLEQRLAISDPGRGSELGQEDGEMCGERLRSGQPARIAAEILAEHRCDGRIRRRALCRSDPAQ
jgi:hypothetical protein